MDDSMTAVYRAVATLGSRLGGTGSNGLVLTELRREDLTDTSLYISS